MVILGIETSCDETSLALIDISTEKGEVSFKLLAHEVLSQTIHSQFGGVFPMMAKREHSKNLIPILIKVLKESGLGFCESGPPERTVSVQAGIKNLESNGERIQTILNREPELLEQFEKFIPSIEKPPIDLIAVTEGPGLEPALWVGINFANALSEIWNIPVVPVNHMEGHIFSALVFGKENPKSEASHALVAENPKPARTETVRSGGQIPKGNQIIKQEKDKFEIKEIEYPAIALLISGGHTQLILIKKEQDYEVVGDTRDDAVGEAFDKIARILGLPYPGGPQISALAERARVENFSTKNFPLPRPMLNSDNLDFSFSGLKTAVLYTVKKLPKFSEENKKEIALETENAIAEVLLKKTSGAIEKFDAKTLILGGGVTANTFIRKSFETLADNYQIPIFLPDKKLSTDNALMIAIAGYFRQKNFDKENRPLKASGTKSLQSKTNF